MNAFKSAFVRTAVVLAFVVAGCVSVAPFERADVFTSMHDSSRTGGE